MITNISYITTNKIRTKLLLFIDKEIRTKKTNTLKIIKNAQSDSVHYIKFEETFSQNDPDKIYFSFCQEHKNFIKFNKPTNKYITNHQNHITNKNIIPKYKIHHCSLYPKNNPEKNNTANLTFIHENKYRNYDLKSNIIINLKGKVYHIKSAKKISSVIEISDKPENDERYLKKLCNSLKIMKFKKNTKRSSICFCKNLIKSRDKLNPHNSFNFFTEYEKNRIRGASTSKNVVNINRIKTKANKIKPFYRKITKKNNSNYNNVNIASEK